MFYVVFIFLSLLAIVALCQRSDIDVHSHKAIQSAEFAVDELSRLSDSGVYETLSLYSIVKAEEEDGIFHYNTILALELQSPYFKSGEEIERFNMVVMEHKVDKVKSFAIDEFPVMDEDAIESFWIKKVDQRRREREKAYRRLGKFMY